MLEQNKIKKMKTLKINKLILLLVGLVVFNGCVEDDDFNTPDTSVVEPSIRWKKLYNSSIGWSLAQDQSRRENLYSHL